VDLILNAVPGAVAGILLDLDAVGIFALAGATWISSSGIVARLLGDLRRLGNRETPAVLSVLVMEDFAMAVYLPILAVAAAGGTAWQAAAGVAGATAVVALAFLASQRWGRQVNGWFVHPDDEQLMLRVLSVTLIVAALAEYVDASAAVGAFLVGLMLSGDLAARARAVLGPLRDLFAIAFFLSIGLAVSPADLVPVLPAALALAAVGAATKMATGAYAARREGVGPRGRRRAGAALIARGEFSIVIVGLADAQSSRLGAVVTAYVLLLGTTGPLAARWVGAGSSAR
jgi:CPA2 family monovalent cation:H+ antiporter-2